MKGEAETILKMAHENSGAARRDPDAGDARNAPSRAYYAAFYAATSALHQLDRAAKSHSGAHELFRVHVVGEGLVDPALARVLPNLFQKRQEAVRQDVQRAEAFVEAVEAWLRGADGEG